MISYLTFKTALGRIEDANRHLSELNRLYLSTIETLAMAIDAKDQITHGHIRRVQQYAVGLAKYLGITDSSQLSAIEAASLLHDMGKLAIPEYILNKPGRLTTAEFERMKLHASIGADILSAIDFPYPVVPIVRHHHENWDGTGYPDGLHSTNIPIGARILSVVDCFDALTSDRPYRPRMSDDDAVRILLSRRGSMYDPTIVDTFIAIYATLAQSMTMSAVEDSVSEATEATSEATHALVPQAQFSRPTPTASLDEIVASTEETLVLYDLAIGLTGHLDLGDVGDVIAKHLRRIVPASAIVFYIYDVNTDDLVSAHAVGSHVPNLLGLRIPRGERLSGWVAANKQTIVNADPALDLGEAGRELRPRLRSCLSPPLIAGNDLIGVLTLYSVDVDAFRDEHRRLLEVVGRQVSVTVKHALHFERHRATNLRDRATGLPNVHHFERLLAIASANILPEDKVSVVFVTARVIAPRGNPSLVPDGAIEVVAAAIRHALRGGDLLFRYAGNELVVLLNQTDAETASLVADRVRATTASALSENANTFGAIGLTIGTATAPTDGLSVGDLVDAARRRERPLSGGKTPNAVH